MIVSFTVKTPEALKLMGFRFFFWNEGFPRHSRGLHNHYKKEYGETFEESGYEGFCFKGNELKKILPYLKPLNKLETDVATKIAQIKRKKFCVIMYMRGDTITYRHELAHAFWYLDRNYRANMRKVIEKASSQFKEELTNSIKFDYHLTHSSVDQFILLDEIQAYCATTNVTTFRKDWGLKTIKNKDLLPFVKIFQNKLTNSLFRINLLN